VHGIAGGEVVGAVGHQVVALDHGGGVVRVDLQLVALDLDLGIERVGALHGAFGLGLADPAGGVGDLAVQVGEVDPVVVDDAQGPDAGGGQVEHQGRAQAAGTDQQHLGIEQPGLADPADLGQHDVAGIAQHLLFGEHGNLIGGATPARASGGAHR
jgi:hypothetical protein